MSEKTVKEKNKEILKKSRKKYLRTAKAERSPTWYRCVKRGSKLFINWISDDDLYELDETYDKYTLKGFHSYIENEFDYSGQYKSNLISVVKELIIRAESDGLDADIDKNSPKSIINHDINIDYAANHNEEFSDIYISPEEHEMVLDAAKNLRDKIILKILWQTGLRPAELSDLKYESVDIEEKKINVDTKKQNNSDDERTIPFKKDLQIALKKWEYGAVKEGYGPESDYLINTKESEKISPDVINKRIKKLIEYSELNNETYSKNVKNYNKKTEKTESVERKYYRYTAKSWRHGFAQKCIEAGMSLPFLSYLMGHSSAEVTEEMYLDIDADDAEEAYRKYI
jgi:integrase/recombinase XerD